MSPRLCAMEHNLPRQFEVPQVAQIFGSVSSDSNQYHCFSSWNAFWWASNTDYKSNNFKASRYWVCKPPTYREIVGSFISPRSLRANKCFFNLSHVWIFLLSCRAYFFINWCHHVAALSQNWVETNATYFIFKLKNRFYRNKPNRSILELVSCHGIQGFQPSTLPPIG